MSINKELLSPGSRDKILKIQIYYETIVQSADADFSVLVWISI